MFIVQLAVSLLGLALPWASVDVRDTPRVTPGFDEVYTSHFDFVWRSVRRLGVPVSLLDDATQDVFVVVHRRLGDFEGRSSMKTWLFGIALRVAKDYRVRARRHDFADVDADTLRAEAESADDTVERREAARLLDTLLTSIDEERRPVFILAELEGVAVPEIAGLLQIPLNTAYSRLRLARADFERAVGRHARRHA